jgi:signal transduction histidine kinase/CheY-like chemotaxis protein
VTDGRSSDERALILARAVRDAELALGLLERFGIAATVCQTYEELIREIRAGAGCAVLTEEVLTRAARDALDEMLSQQPPWSDFPIILFSSQPTSSSLRALHGIQSLGNVTVLDRPVQMRTFVSAVRGALRSRRHQYEARRAIEQRDQFLAMLGHELRNPLGAISFATEILKIKTGDLATNECSIIERQTRHLVRLIDDLLDVARVTSGKITLEKTSIDLNVLAESCLQLVTKASHDKMQTLSLIRGPRAIWVEGDWDRLQQVVSNLLINAIKYSPRFSSTELQVESDGTWASVRVRDQGAGIAPQHLERIFDLFVQQETTLDRSQGGLGIGLTLVRRLVSLHGGTVEAKSEGLGRGSEFIVRLRERTPAAGRREEETTIQPVSQPWRVLVVEDHDDIREVCAALLVDLGYQIDVAADGREGVRRAIEQRPDAALIDIGLPELDGYAVAAQLRAAFGDDVLLVAMSGYGQPEDRQRAFDAGFDSHLTKPIDVQRLRSALTALETS